MKVLAIIFGFAFAMVVIVFSFSNIKHNAEVGQYKDSLYRTQDSLFWVRKENEILINFISE